MVRGAWCGGGERLSNGRLSSSATVAFGKMMRVSTFTDAAVTELTMASMADGKRASSPVAKLSESKVSTEPATV